jgi:hypothetical protein
MPLAPKTQLVPVSYKGLGEPSIAATPDAENKQCVSFR